MMSQIPLSSAVQRPQSHGWAWLETPSTGEQTRARGPWARSRKICHEQLLRVLRWQVYSRFKSGAERISVQTVMWKDGITAIPALRWLSLSSFLPSGLLCSVPFGCLHIITGISLIVPQNSDVHQQQKRSQAWESGTSAVTFACWRWYTAWQSHIRVFNVK